jgi:hypothetical protein
MTIPIPERGQPLDTNYIAKIVDGVNEALKNTSYATNKYFSVDTSGSGTQTVKMTDAKVIGGYYSVYNNTPVLANDVAEFTYKFPSNFKFPPIVTATPINIGDNVAGRNLTVILKSVTNSQVVGTVKFNEGGNLSVAVNIIAVGIPA